LAPEEKTLIEIAAAAASTVRNRWIVITQVLWAGWK
jgi:hypothetical protein